MSARSPRFLAAALAAALAIGCSGDWSRPHKAPGSAAWLPRGGALDPPTLARLRRAGVGELFVPAARLEWNGDRPKLRAERLEGLPPRAPVTLVVDGAWPSGELADDDETGERLAAELGKLLLAAESRGLAPLGVHLDIAGAGEHESYAAALAAARSELARDAFLSATLGRGEWEGEAAERLARSVDFLVAFLYGQRAEEPESAAAWDLDQIEPRLARLDRLERAYLVGLSTVGSATRLAAAGEPLASSTSVSLRALVAEPGLALRQGFGLRSGARLVHVFQVTEPTRVAGWDLRPGESVRVVRTHGAYLEDVAERLASRPSRHRLGEIYHRLPAPGERLVIPTESLLAARAPGRAAPELEIALELIERTPRRLWLRVRLENRSGESTDLALLNHNYVELNATGALFGRADAGTFQRYQLRRRGVEELTFRTARAADQLRLHLPVLEGRDSAVSGPLELRLTGGEPRLEVASRFLLPGGREVGTPPTPWRPPG
jgi:hypothetical protein